MILVVALIGAVGVWLYLRSQHVNPGSLPPADASIAAATPDGGNWTASDGTVYQKLGGMSFVVTPSQAMKDLAAAGATAYDINDPATAQRRLDALNRAQKLEDQAAAQGLTVDQTYQNHLAQSLADQAKETAVIMAVGGGSTVTPPVVTPPIVNQPTASPTVPTAPGAVTGPVYEARRGAGHFGMTLPGSTPPVQVAAGTNPQTAAYVNAVLNAGPKTPPPSPGMTWNYTTQQWEWALA